MHAKNKAFIALQLLGAFFFFLVAITAAFSSRVKRYATWYSFCASWVISGISYSLMLVVEAYAGAQGLHRWHPNVEVGSVEWKAEKVCMTQAAFIYASPALTGFTSLAMCFHVLLYVRVALEVPMGRVKAMTTTVLVVVPYVIWVIMFAVLFQLSQAQPNTVELDRSGYYCHLALPEPVAVCSGIAIFASISVAIVETLMARAVHKYRDALPRTTHSITFTLRVLLFGFVDLFALIIGLLLLIPASRNLGVNFLLSLIPMLGIFIFGSQTDILHVWMFWKRPFPESMASQPIPTRHCSDDADSFTLRQPNARSKRGRRRSTSQSKLGPFSVSSDLSTTFRTANPRALSISMLDDAVDTTYEVDERINASNTSRLSKKY
ncbi:hypothetical protein DFJ43DRAFT_1158005 [Lentinula guzmanii]|uniref:Uncharacterized protein n=1 Tax=Lentinula guzmanii TaxID=2804957 RepID=A0AA38MS71_9AGAR|nr:hypothetical protein DFJ43DRAFT_1158005 [Lentinula guzmanii]